MHTNAFYRNLEFAILELPVNELTFSSIDGAENGYEFIYYY
jgi:hypothetical protein